MTMASRVRAETKEKRRVPATSLVRGGEDDGEGEGESGRSGGSGG